MTDINFDTNKSENFVIEKAGNPWLGFVPGKGIVTIFGTFVDNIWRIGAATLQNGNWEISEPFKISAPSIHVCDPHVVETEQGLIMTVSYDQHSIYKLRSPMTLEQLFNSFGALPEEVAMSQLTSRTDHYIKTLF